MELLYSGFDGLDVAYRAALPKDLANKLELVKAQAKKSKTDMIYGHNGIELRVAQTGGNGGYAYQCSTGDLGAIFFFKAPSPNDPWGIRVSVRALALATLGLDGAKTYVENTLSALGVPLGPQAESIGRVDLAFDYLAPGFVLSQNQFVMHARSNRKTHYDLDEQYEHGRSGRVTSVTVGKNPGQQVIIYDKREEVITRGKVAWPEIWNAELRKRGLAALDMTNASSSRVWRVEVRAHKKHLKSTCGITTWHDLSDKAPAMFAKMLNAIRYAEPTGDTNRARWPDQALWKAVRRDLDRALQGLPSVVEPDAIRHALVEERDRMLAAQVEGCMISLLALRGCEQSGLGAAIASEAEAMSKRLESDPKRTKERLKRAHTKYVPLVKAALPTDDAPREHTSI